MITKTGMLGLKLTIAVMLITAVQPADAALIKYSFFSFVSPNSALAFGSISYNTRRGFTDVSITTSADPTCCRGMGNPGRVYDQVDLLGQADRPFELWAWEQSATGAVGDAALFIDFIPWTSDSLDRLEVGFGIEGICEQTPSPNSCLISQDRIFRLGAGRAIAQEVIPMNEPNAAALFAIGLFLTLFSVR